MISNSCQIALFGRLTPFSVLPRGAHLISFFFDAADEVNSLIEKAAELSDDAQAELLHRLAEMRTQDLGIDDHEDEEPGQYKSWMNSSSTAPQAAPFKATPAGRPAADLDRNGSAQTSNVRRLRGKRRFYPTKENFALQEDRQLGSEPMDVGAPDPLPRLLHALPSPSRRLQRQRDDEPAFRPQTLGGLAAISLVVVD